MRKNYNKRDRLGCPRDGRESKKILCREKFSTFKSLIEEFFSTLIPDEGGLVAWLLLSPDLILTDREFMQTTVHMVYGYVNTETFADLQTLLFMASLTVDGI